MIVPPQAELLICHPHSFQLKQRLKPPVKSLQESKNAEISTGDSDTTVQQEHDRKAGASDQQRQNFPFVPDIALLRIQEQHSLTRRLKSKINARV